MTILKNKIIKQPSTLFLKISIILVAVFVLSVCTILTYDVVSKGDALFLPVILVIDLTALPFFIGLIETFKILNYIDRGLAFSILSVKALQRIKQLSVMTGLIYSIGMPFIFNAADKDDAPGMVLFALVIIFMTVVVAIFSSVLEKLLKEALILKSENDLTV